MVEERAVATIGELMINIPSLQTLNACLKILRRLTENSQGSSEADNPTQKEILKYMMYEERASRFFQTLEKCCVNSLDTITDINKQYNLYHLRRVSLAQVDPSRQKQ